MLRWLQPLLILWALPYTLLGGLVGLATICTGGRAQVRLPVIEFHGGAARWLLRQLFFGRGASAMTLGHTVLGQTPACLDRSRAHELIHVRQYERWGPFFGPAYLLCSLLLWCRGRNPYLDNPFEREAFERSASSPPAGKRHIDRRWDG